VGCAVLCCADDSRTHRWPGDIDHTVFRSAGVHTFIQEFREEMISAHLFRQATGQSVGMDDGCGEANDYFFAK
jgi:hypothetical protein